MSSPSTPSWTMVGRGRGRSRRSPFRTVAEVLQQPIKHIEFVVKLYHLQVHGERYFLHEHPAHTTSWQLDAVRALLAVPSVQRVTGDQCQHEAEVQEGSTRAAR